MAATLRLSPGPLKGALRRVRARPAPTPATSRSHVLAPLVGMAVGAASGALAGKFSDVGVDDNFMKKLGASIPEGGAALIVLGRSDAPEKVIERVGSYGGEVIQTSLKPEEEDRLRSALGESVATV